MKKWILCVMMTFCVQTAVFAVNDNTISNLFTPLIKSYAQFGKINGVDTLLIDYKNMGRDPSYARLLQSLAVLNPGELNSSESETAFWINVYNIAVIKWIVENPKTKSLNKLGSLFKPVEDKPIITVFGEKMSLNDIKEKVKPESDVRLYFVLTDASISGPDLPLEAFTETSLNRQIQDAVTFYLSNTTKGLWVDFENKNFYVGSLFKKHKSSFESESKLRSFINGYTTKRLEKYEMMFFKEDQTLNALNTVRF